jgi:hypothetical protein
MKFFSNGSSRRFSSRAVAKFYVIDALGLTAQQSRGAENQDLRAEYLAKLRTV